MRGYIKIEETAEKVLIFHIRTMYSICSSRVSSGAGSGPARARDAGERFCRRERTRLSSLKNRFYTAVPVIRQDIMSALKNKGIYLLDPESANGYSIGAAIAILVPFAIFQYHRDGRTFSTRPSLLIVCIPSLARDLVAVCSRHDG